MITFPDAAQGYGYTVMGTLSRAVAAKPMGKYDTPVVVITEQEYSGLRGQRAARPHRAAECRAGRHRGREGGGRVNAEQQEILTIVQAMIRAEVRMADMRVAIAHMQRKQDKRRHELRKRMTARAKREEVA